MATGRLRSDFVPTKRSALVHTERVVARFGNGDDVSAVVYVVVTVAVFALLGLVQKLVERL